MSNIVMPTGWSVYRHGTDEVTWKHSSHTSEAPVLWIIKSAPPKSTGRMTYLHRIVIGLKEAGSENTQNMIMDVRCSNAPDQDQVVVAARLAQILPAIGAAGGVEDMCVSGDLPY